MKKTKPKFTERFTPVILTEIFYSCVFPFAIMFGVAGVLDGCTNLERQYEFTFREEERNLYNRMRFFRWLAFDTCPRQEEINQLKLEAEKYMEAQNDKP